MSAGSKRHVECPESQPGNEDTHFSRSRMVSHRTGRKLGINRETVGRYLRSAEAKPAISTVGFGAHSESKTSHSDPDVEDVRPNDGTPWRQAAPLYNLHLMIGESASTAVT